MERSPHPMHNTLIAPSRRKPCVSIHAAIRRILHLFLCFSSTFSSLRGIIRSHYSQAEATLTALHQQKRVWQIDTVTTNPARIPPISAVEPRSEFGAGAGIFPLRWSGLQVGRGTAMGQNLEMKVPGAKISPSMLSSDFANLASEAKFIEECGADWLHMDIMDGHYVPNLTIGAPVIKSLRKHTKMFMDCHLMVTNPMDYVDDFVKAGASGFTFHVEVSKDNWQELVHKIKAGGMRAGVALRPGTPIEEVFPLVESEEPVDMVLVMTVEPGFGGQSFMPETMPKVNALRRKFPHLDIEVDGGLSPATIKQAADAGANCIVAGSAVFGAKDPAAVITTLRKGVDDAQASSVFFK